MSICALADYDTVHMRIPSERFQKAPLNLQLLLKADLMEGGGRDDIQRKVRAVSARRSCHRRLRYRGGPQESRSNPDLFRRPRISVGPGSGFLYFSVATGYRTPYPVYLQRFFTTNSSASCLCSGLLSSSFHSLEAYHLSRLFLSSNRDVNPCS